MTATREQTVGSALASQALANAAMVELLRLGHKDLLPEIEKRALETLTPSLERAELQMDKDAALDAGRLTIVSQIGAATAIAALETALRQ